MRLGLTFILSLLCLPIETVHADVSAGEFTKWADEYKQEYIDSYSTDTFMCPAPSLPLDINKMPAITVMRSCRPAESLKDVLYDENLSEQEKRQRDDLICDCFIHGNTYESTTVKDLPPVEKAIRERVWRERASQMSELQYASKVFGEGFGPAITSMNFADTTAQAERLAGVYLQYDRKIEPRDTESLKNILTPPNLSDEMCVPPREFIFNEQFPMDATFYDDLKRPFKPDDWDYAKLAKKFDGVTKLEDVNKIPDSGSILNRMKFLLHNPQFKAMFMSPDADSAGAKEKLYKMLQEHLPKPECADIQCFPVGNWREQIHPYQDAAREFLRDPFVIGNIQSGIREGQKLGWSKKKLNTSDLLGDPLHASQHDWRTFCDFRTTDPGPINPILAEIEDKYGLDFENINSNKDFENTNKAYCTIPRRDKDNHPMLFGDYRKQNCAQVNRRTCLAKFVQAYPFSTSNTIGLNYNINDILEKPDTIAQVTSESTTTITTIGSDSRVRSQSIQFLDDQPAHIPSRTVLADAAVPAKVTAPANATNATTQFNQQLLNPQQTFVQEPIFQPQIQASRPNAVAPQKGETIRENLSQGESQAQLLRNEISSLRAQLIGRASVKGSQAGEPSSLEQRLAALERRLTDKERENSDLRQQMSAALKPQTVAAPEIAPSREATERQNFFGYSNSVATSMAPQAVTAPAAMSAPMAGGGFSPSPLSSPSRPVASPGSDLLSSKYSLQDSGVAGGITIASSGRSQSEKSVLPLTVSSEEFNQLASNDDSALSKYLPQVNALPGEVVRLAIKTSDDRSMEVFVVSNGSVFSIFRTPEEASALAAGRRPASVIERSKTLEDLKNQFTN